MQEASYTLNSKESEVLHAMPSPKGDATLGEYIEISDIAGKAFEKKGTSSKTKGNSWVRNSMRKLLRLGLVKHKGSKSGLYARTTLKPSDIIAKHKADAAAKVAAKEAKAAKKAAKGKKTAAEKSS